MEGTGHSRPPSHRRLSSAALGQVRAAPLRNRAATRARDARRRLDGRAGRAPLPRRTRAAARHRGEARDPPDPPPTTPLRPAFDRPPPRPLPPLGLSRWYHPPSRPAAHCAHASAALGQAQLPLGLLSVLCALLALMPLSLLVGELL